MAAGTNVCSYPVMRQLALFASAASPMRLVGDRGDVTYVPEFLDRALADALVRELSADTHWRADTREMYGKRVLVPRETPLSEIHLENMLALSRMGVQIVPPMPAFPLPAVTEPGELLVTLTICCTFVSTFAGAGSKTGVAVRM